MAWKDDVVDAEKLRLDLRNPRLPKYIKDYNDESHIRNYLLKRTDVMSIARSIAKGGYHKSVISITCIEKGEIIVLDGNRRLAACQLLLNPELAPNVGAKKELQGLSKELNRDELANIKITVAPSRKEANKEIWDIHVNKLLRPWERLERLRMHAELVDNEGYDIESAAKEYGVTPGDFKTQLETLFFYEKLIEEVDGKEDDETLRRVFNKIDRILLSSNGKKLLQYSIDKKGHIIPKNKIAFDAVFKKLVPYIVSHDEIGAQISQADLIEKVYHKIDPIKFSLKKSASIPNKKPKTTKKKGNSAKSTQNFPLEVIGSDEKIFNIRSPGEAINVIKVICSRFYAFDGKLKNSARMGRKPALIKDEHDAQYFIEAILEIFFRNVKTEEWTPSYLTGSKRVDFFLPEFEIVIEVKMTNDKLKDKKLRDELIVDIVHYGEMEKCRTLICFIYNPDNKLKNPGAIKADLEKKKVTDIDQVIALIEP